jgi:hypothetical protein
LVTGKSLGKDMFSLEEKATVSREGDIFKSESINIHSPGQPDTSTMISSDALDSEKGLGAAHQEQQGNTQPEDSFSVFSQAEKKFIVFIAALATLIAPLTASIYYPVITVLAVDLDVSTTNINLTITTYLVYTSRNRRGHTSIC